MVIFKQIRGPKGNTISGGKNPVEPFLSRDREAGGAKVFITFNKVREKVKAFREVVHAFTRNL